MIRKILLTVILVTTCASIHAQEEKDSPEAIIKEFFSLLDENKAERAVEYIFSNNPWMKGVKSIESIMSELKANVNKMGEFHGAQQLSKATAGKDLVSYSYLAKYSRQPLRFVFAFYRPEDKWQIHYFKYDDELTDELLEALAVYRLSENIDLGGY
ncbi:hypothetical protein [Roseivirga sp.]|uniref:hypothetical protein n=1 Tax=Roseivirga sp. TaxID=1964215 RepID=UPI003B529A04